MDLFNNLLDFFYVLADICEKLYNWLFTPITFLGYTFIPLFVAGSVVIVIMIFKVFT